MRNVGLAIMGYVNSKNVFPPAGTFCEDATTLTSLTSGTIDPSQSVINGYMPGGTPRTTSVPMYSWVLLILPYMENQDMFNQWTMYTTTSAGGNIAVSFFDPTNYIAGQASNNTIANTALGVLKCPDDITTQPNQGNLSYVVNGGFALWHPIPYSVTGSQIDGGQTGTILQWATGTSPANYLSTMGVTQKLGVMFLQSQFPQGVQTKDPLERGFDADEPGGRPSSTLLVSENTLAGVASPNAFTANLEGNWASPVPTLSMFIGSPAVCGVPTTTNCTSGQLAPASATAAPARPVATSTARAGLTRTRSAPSRTSTSART